MSAEDYQIPYAIIEEKANGKVDTIDIEDNQEKLDYKLSGEQKRILGRAAFDLLDLVE